jgi:PIN domain nuclease of toxin-antitoxin system
VNQRFIVDTHAVLWYLTADARLSSKALAILRDAGSLLFIPAIVVAESLYIIEHGKSPATPTQLWDFVRLSSNVSFCPVDETILKQAETLTTIPEMHDRLIVATAVCL